jgi:hypothetical protein
LLLQANKELKLEEIKVGVQNTTLPTNRGGRPVLGFVGNVLIQGANAIASANGDSAAP